MPTGRSKMSFTEKKVSINAVIALILGILLLLAHGTMMVFAIRTKGNVPFAGGVLETYLLLLSIFGILWAFLSFDDEKTVGKYKVLGVVLNGIALCLSLIVMGIGMSGM